MNFRFTDMVNFGNHINFCMEKVLQLDSIATYNQLRGVKTQHPLVSLINFAEQEANFLPPGKINFGFYAIMLKEMVCGTLQYGRSLYDYQEGTLVFIGPGQVLSVEKKTEVEKPSGWALVFHPDFIRNTSLGKHIREYNFFSYDLNEALHLSEKERQVVIDCFQKIEYELQQSIDKHSKRLIVANIELLLNYCIRFYDRQFITRDPANSSVVEKFETLLNDYFASDKPQQQGIPSVSYFAGELNLSPNYFGDLIKKETGKSAQEYIQLKLMDIAKEKIHDSSKSVSEIAYSLGFKYPQHFTRLFKQKVGFSPNAYRGLN